MQVITIHSPSKIQLSVSTNLR
ncbi:hypothetical protein Gotur_017455 [Gossypium turneri]